MSRYPLRTVYIHLVRICTTDVKKTENRKQKWAFAHASLAQKQLGSAKVSLATYTNNDNSYNSSASSVRPQDKNIISLHSECTDVGVLSISEVVCCPDRQAGGSVVNTGRFTDYCVLYLSWDFELLYHPQLKEAADTALDEFQLWQGEVAEAELEQLHGLGFRDVGSLHIGNRVQTVSAPSQTSWVYEERCGLRNSTHRSAYQQFVHLLLVTVFWCGAKLVLCVLWRDDELKRQLDLLNCFQSDWRNMSQVGQQLTRMVCTSFSEAFVWYMSISWAISFLHSVLFSLSYVSLFRVDQPRNCVRAWHGQIKHNRFNSVSTINNYNN